jgi:hypothetical protein
MRANTPPPVTVQPKKLTALAQSTILLTLPFNQPLSRHSANEAAYSKYMSANTLYFDFPDSSSKTNDPRGVN